jgi:hypothetical protein
LSENIRHFDVKRSSERSFGIVFAIVFFLVALYPAVTGGEVREWSLIIAVAFLNLAFIAPKALTIPNKLWFKLGLFLGHGAGFISMGIVYLTTVLPIGILIKLLGIDLLCLKVDKKATTYWVARKQPIGTMQDQF